MKPLYFGLLLCLASMALAALVAVLADAGPITASASGENPLLRLTPSDRVSEPIAGRVEERIAAGPYTYLAVRGERARIWVVTLGKGAPNGTDVRVRSVGRQLNFYSNRLRRTFPELAFGFVSRIEQQ